MKIIITITICLFSSSLFSADNFLTGFSISPIIGIERVQKIEPTPHTKERYIYGFNLLFGPPVFSLEAEGVKSDDNEVFDDTKISEESIAVKVGLRSGFNLGFIRWYLRAGGHARQKKITKTQNLSLSKQIVTKTEPAIKVSPYAGTGFKVFLDKGFFITGGVTGIFTGEPKGSDREYQVDLAWGMKF